MFLCSRSLITSLVMFVFLNAVHASPFPQDVELPGAQQEAPSTCVYSCPPKDARGLELVSKPGSLGPSSHYTIIECIYAPANWQSSAHTCSFSKVNGASMLGYVEDGCPPSATCSTPDSKPRFSSQDKDGVELMVDKLAKMERAKGFLWTKLHPY